MVAAEAVTVLPHQAIIAEATEDQSLDLDLATAMLPPEPTMVAALLFEAMIADTTEAVSVMATIADLFLEATTVALLLEAPIVAMALHIATTAAMADLKATTVVMADLVARSVALLLADTTESIAHLAMTTENQKSTSPTMLLKSSAIMVRTMASASRS